MIRKSRPACRVRVSHSPGSALPHKKWIYRAKHHHRETIRSIRHTKTKWKREGRDLLNIRYTTFNWKRRSHRELGSPSPHDRSNVTSGIRISQHSFARKSCPQVGYSSTSDGGAVFAFEEAIHGFTINPTSLREQAIYSTPLPDIPIPQVGDSLSNNCGSAGVSDENLSHDVICRRLQYMDLFYRYRREEPCVAYLKHELDILKDKNIDATTTTQPDCECSGAKGCAQKAHDTAVELNMRYCEKKNW